MLIYRKCIRAQRRHYLFYTSNSPRSCQKVAVLTNDINPEEFQITAVHHQGVRMGEPSECFDYQQKGSSRCCSSVLCYLRRSLPPNGRASSSASSEVRSEPHPPGHPQSGTCGYIFLRVSVTYFRIDTQQAAIAFPIIYQHRKFIHQFKATSVSGGSVLYKKPSRSIWTDWQRLW